MSKCTICGSNDFIVIDWNNGILTTTTYECIKCKTEVYSVDSPRLYKYTGKYNSISKEDVERINEKEELIKNKTIIHEFY